MKQALLRKVFLPLAVLMLVLSTIAPSIQVSAAEGEINVDLSITGGIVTEEEINTSGATLTLDLPDNKWASDIVTNSDKLKVLKSNFTADINQSSWKTLIDSATVTRTTDRRLTIVISSSAGYDIPDNQTISVNLSPALIENWEGTVTAKAFTIYAKPELSLGGSAISSSVEDFKRGGKILEINLLNAKWNTAKVKTLTGWEQVLTGFEETPGSTVWSVVNQLKTIDPNKVVTFANENRTLQIKLPPGLTAVDGKTVTYNLTAASLTNEYAIDTVDNNKKVGTSLTVSSSHSSFTITSEPSLAVDALTVKEAAINTSATGKIILKLQNAQWNTLDGAKKRALVDALVAKNQPEQWEKVKDALKNKLGSIVLSGDTVTITIPKVPEYYLTADQTISFKMPYQLLQDEVKIADVSFSVEATPKALISGSATPEISQADIVKGGKTVVVTLVNSKWESDVASNTTKREKLISAFTGWDAATTATMKARSTVKRNNDRTVTITLPSIAGFKTSQKTDIKFKPPGDLTDSQSTFDKTVFNAFSIVPVSVSTPAISGSILSNITEFDMIEGGKELTITLKNDQWVKNLTTSPILFTAKDSNGISVTLPSASIVRKSDTVATLTFAASSSFKLNADAIVDFEIPAQLLTVSSNPIKVTTAFKIAAVKAEVSGTGVSLDPIDVQKGGKTIVVTLKNATFKKSGDFSRLITDAAASSDWAKVVAAVKGDSKSISVTNNKVTIKLPAVPGYGKVDGETVAITIPKELTNEGKRDLTGDQTIQIGQVAKASLSGGVIMDTAIKSGSNTFTITLDGAKWDTAISTNKSKQSALLKGFTSTDQAKELAVLRTEIQNSGSFTVSEDGRRLTVRIPVIPDYSIIRDQSITIVIPKTVLSGYKYDLPLTSQLVIKVPDTSKDRTLGELLQEDLAEYINTHGINNIRVTVPQKMVESVTINTTELPLKDGATSSITTIEVTTHSDVAKVEVTAGGVTRESNTSRTSTFVFSNVDKNSDVMIAAYAAGSSDPIEGEIFKKVGTGSKTYNELPKNDLSGSYSLRTLLTSKTLLKDILKYYTVDDLRVGI